VDCLARPAAFVPVRPPKPRPSLSCVLSVSRSLTIITGGNLPGANPAFRATALYVNRQLFDCEMKLAGAAGGVPCAISDGRKRTTPLILLSHGRDRDIGKLAALLGGGKFRPKMAGDRSLSKGEKAKEDRRFESPLLQQRVTANRRSRSQFLCFDACRV
jgi:hypothetical protein